MGFYNSRVVMGKQRRVIRKEGTKAPLLHTPCIILQAEEQIQKQNRRELKFEASVIYSASSR